MSEDKIKAAVALAESYGGIDGAHHKQWLLDQMVRALLAEDYEEWRRAYNAYVNDEGETYDPWDEGIAP